MENKKQRGVSTLVGIIIIIAAVVVLFGGVFAYNQYRIYSSPIKIPGINEPMPRINTAGWKTYTNTQYGFEIKYTPVGAVDNNGNGDFSVTFHSNDQANPYLQIIVTTNSICSDDFLGRTTALVAIDGVNFIKGDVSGDFNGNQTRGYADEYCATKGGLTYRLISHLFYSYLATGSDIPPRSRLENDPYVNQAIDTFKFVTLSANQAACISEGGSYGAPGSSKDFCCAGLTEQPTSQSGTSGLCVKSNNQSTQSSIRVSLPPESACVWGKQCHITWTSNKITNLTVDLEITNIHQAPINGSDLVNLAVNIPASIGEYFWNVPSDGSVPAADGSYKIKICGTTTGGTTAICDESGYLAIWQQTQ